MKLEQRERLDPTSKQDQTLAELITSLRDDSFRSTQKVRTLMREELDYSLKLKHYHNDTGQTRNQQMVQPHGPEMFNHIRHQWAQMTAVPTYIECRPQQPGTDDPAMAEDAKLALESVLHDPLKGYDKTRRRWIMGGLAARQWVMAVDVEPTPQYPNGDVCFRLIPGWLFHVAPGWQEMHEYTCPWVGEESTMRYGDVMSRKGWKNLDQVMPDTRATSGRGSIDQASYAPLGNSSVWQKTPVANEDTPSATEIVTIYKWWFRFDGETYTEETDVPLSPYEQYAECPMCGYQTADVPRDLDGSVATSTQVDMCPQCGAAPLLPVREAVKEDTYFRFPKGRLVIVAPKCGVVLFDDEWPHEMRSFPYAMARAYDHPMDVSGLSETALHWTSQMVLNNLRRFGWEQMRRNVDVLVAPKDGLVNSKNQTFQWTDMQGQIAYWTKMEAVNGIKHFQGSGIPTGLPALYNIFSEQFQTGRGSTDLGMTASQIKGTPVGTVQTFVEQGELPGRDKIKAIQEEESVFFGVVLDILCQIWQDGRAVRYLGPEGEFKIKQLQQASLTNMEVFVTAAPTMAIIKGDELRNLIEWTRLMATDPAAGMIAAEMANLPPSAVRRYMQMRQQLGTFMPPEEAAKAAAAGGSPPGAAGLPKGAGGTIGATP